MAYYCLFNGTGYLTAPTLGNLVTGSPKIRINIKKFKWFGTATQPIFYQGGSSGANREFVLRNNSNVGQIYVGGGVTGFTWPDLTAAFGDANLTCDEFGFEINGSNANFYKDGTAVFTVSSISRGTTRIDGALLFLGAQQADNTGGSTAGNAIAPNLTQYGDIQIFINDVLVRNYTMPSTGTTVPDSVAGNNLTQRGTWPANDSEWVFYSSGASNSATISGNLPKLVGSITLNEINPINSAAVNGQLPKLAGAVSILQKQSVTVAGQMPKLTGSASLRLKQSAAVSGQLPRMTGSLSLMSTSNNKQITVTATMPKMTSSIQLSQELTAAVAGTMPRMTADIQLRLAGVYPQADAGAFVVSYRIAGDTVLTASISESMRFSAIISQSTNIKYMVN